MNELKLNTNCGLVLWEKGILKFSILEEVSPFYGSYINL